MYAPRKSVSELDDMLPELGLRFDAEARAARQLEVPIDAAHLRLDKAQIGVEHRMLMLVKRNVGQACGAEQARRVKNTDADRGMRNDAHPLRGRVLADGHELRQSRMRDFRLDDGDTAMRETRRHLEKRAPFFAAGDRYGNVGGNISLAIDIFWRAGRFG